MMLFPTSRVLSFHTEEDRKAQSTTFYFNQARDFVLSCYINKISFTTVYACFFFFFFEIVILVQI